MIPVSDTVRARTFPYVNVALILANIAVFIYELTLSPGEINRFLTDWGVVPARLIDWLEGPSGSDREELFTPLTSMFLHGGWFHLIGNMLFLWVFGDNVEDALGHLRYLFFYVITGIGAVALQVFIDQDGLIPMVGASGAIAGVLGGYLVLYPRATVGVLIPWLWFLGIFPVPAVLLIGFWFLLQLFNGIASIGIAVGVTSGVAYWAHIGGFLAGLILIWVVPRRRRFYPS
ncbi:MAG: rhomboid family intramembrane serine protease [Dehalococcoidia bacterium]